ncbi:hypothetical protein [Methylobacterium gossipiicola]|uniref:CopL family metal-binding regulatory protein n=1 Tax=Methylobacterium gossipiicola TaxID=582675 RepID=A0A1I2VX45_9HYPH|nr:hypothetical protein [Methylobacterium gossipiicola]SFG93778.1 hypothetical protein SAMN05192565_11833 [Methylobacterium gossipiicola]
MTCARTLALWLVATIVLIAAGLMPSGAEAHAGHAHGGPGRPSVAAPTTLATVTKSVTAATVQASPETGLARPCDGACCRAPGTHCCTGAALAADPQAALPPRDPAGRALPRAFPARTDVVPEALPEPPRSFA